MNRIVFIIVPIAMMITAVFAMIGIETWLAGFGKTEAARLTLGRIGISAAYMVAAANGVIFLFATAGSGYFAMAVYFIKALDIPNVWFSRAAWLPWSIKGSGSG
jgi:type IV secretion system protein VirD4